jgi:penicillin amidase
MRYLPALLSAVFTAAVVYLLDRPLGESPSLGRLLDPFRGVWNNARQAEPEPGSTSLVLPGLSGPVTVRYDEQGVPHIFAPSWLDAIRAQGYVTAQDRLWQMEFQTHAAAGRMAEILGPDLDAKGDGRILRYDRLQRRQGLGYAAEQALTAIAKDDSMMAFLDAYAEGVNAWIDQLKPEDYPIEYKLLDYAPEPWAPLKTALLMKYMGQDLASTEYDLPFTNLLRKLGREEFNRLFPEDANTDPIVPPGTPYPFAPLDLDTPEAYEPPALASLPPAFSPDYRQPDRGIGSNNWAVHGSRTASGAPILCNDPHLQLNLPSIWYQVQLYAPGLNVYGASLPGAPGVVIGFNRDIAWGVTNAGRDVRDWYRIEFRDASRREYKFEGQWRPAKARVETLRIKGQPEQYDTVWYTHHGPVVYDRSFEHRELEGYALRWELHQPSNEMKTFLVLNSADSYADYRRALPNFQCPGQNFLFASRKGDIAITQQGRFPARWPGQGRFLLDGSRADHEWQAYIPAGQNPTSVNPPRGFVSSANQYPADSSYPFYQLGYFEEYRNRRVNERLADMGNRITPQDLMALQLDNYGLMAAEALPVMLEAFPPARQELGNWDYFYHAGSREAARFQSWYNALYALIWDEFEGDDQAPTQIRPEHYPTIALMKADPQSTWFDDQRTPQRENLAALAAKAWEQSQTDLDWWEFKHTSIAHLLKLDPFSVLNVQSGGNRNIVNATSERNGPSWRMVVEMSDPPRAWGIYPGGQNGNPASPEATRFIPDWAAGKYYELLFLLSPDDRPEQTPRQLLLHAP